MTFLALCVVSAALSIVFGCGTVFCSASAMVSDGAIIIGFNNSKLAVLFLALTLALAWVSGYSAALVL